LLVNWHNVRYCILLTNVASTADDFVAVGVGRCPDPEGIDQHVTDGNPGTSGGDAGVRSYLMGLGPLGVVKPEILR
jgi:hypothetical protein